MTLTRRFPALDATLNPSCPIRVRGRKHPDGKVYVIPEPSIRVGLKMVALLSDPDAELRAVAEYDFMAELCGDAWDEMRGDGVRHSMMLHAGRTALIYFGISPTKAEIYAAGGPSPGERVRPRWTTPRLWSRSICRRRVRTARMTPVVGR